MPHRRVVGVGLLYIPTVSVGYFSAQVFDLGKSDQDLHALASQGGIQSEQITKPVKSIG